MPDFPTLQQLVNALGWMLVHFLWQGSLIAALLWVVFRLSRPESAVLRYWSGLAAYLACALAPLITLGYYLGPVTARVVTAELSLPVFTVATGYRVSAWQSLQLGLEPALPLIVALWAVGVIVLSSRTFMGWLGTRKLVRSGQVPRGLDLQALVEQLQARLGVRRAVRVLQSTRVAVPTLIGWLKPVILLPASVITQLPAAQLEMILAHELAHVRRHDYLVNLLQIVIETLFFYHPAVRWMSRQVGQEREHCCDDMVVARCGQPVVYARALASLEALREPVRPPALAASGGDLFQRVSRIVRHDLHLPRSSSGFAQVALIAAIALAASLSARHGMEMSRSGTTGAMALPASVTATPIASRAGLSLGAGYRQYGAQQLEARRESQREARAAEARSELEARLARLAPVEVRGARQVFEPTPNDVAHDRDKVQLASLPEPPVRDEIRQPIEEQAGEVLRPRVRAVQVVAPKYPSRAERDEIEGFVKLRFTVSARGRPVNIEVVEASPPELFDRAAIKALKRWDFEVSPGHDSDQPLVQTFDFALVDVEPEQDTGRKSNRCSMTGSRICPRNVTEDDIQGHYNRNSD